MFIIRAMGFNNSFNGEYYSDQQRANDEAKRLAESYRNTFMVCKVVDIALFKPPYMTLDEGHKETCPECEG